MGLDLTKNADGFRLVPETLSNGLLYGTIILMVVGFAWFLYDRM